MKKSFFILLLFSVLVLSGCVQKQADVEKELEKQQYEVENQAAVEPVETKYKAKISYLRTKSYGVTTEYVYNEPKHSIDIDESADISISVSKSDGSKVESAIVKIDDKVLEELFPGSYGSSINFEGGEYILSIDIDGDGENEAEQAINIPGVEIASPEHGSQISIEGFNLAWNVFGDFKDYQYTHSLYNAGDGYCRGETNLSGSIKAKELAEPKIFINEKIESGLYQLMFKTVDFIKDSNNQDSIQFSGSAQDVIDIELVAGNICQCCNHFAPPCDPDKEYPYCN